ncbi:MAG: hypothetical protein ABI134_14670 [Byssovorax sp.]
MTSLSRSSSRRALVGGAFVAGTMLISVSALAEPPPPLPIPPATPAAVAPAPPPPARAALPPQSDPQRLRSPDYVYVPGDWAASSMPGMPSRRVWYGWQTLLLYAASTTVGLASGFAGGASDSGFLVVAGSVVGGTGLVLGGPIVHWAHGNTSRGFAALGLNFGATLASGGVGIGIACAAGGCNGSSQGLGIFVGLVFGGAAGLLTAMIIDVSALSYETTAPVASSASKRSPGWTILPDLKISQERTTFGFAGVF